MVAGVAITSGGGQSQYSGKMTPFVVLSCTMAAMGGVIFGYDIGISGGVTIMEPFLEKFFPEMYIKMKAFGRKPSILAGGAAFLAGAALGGVALNVYMLIFGRIIFLIKNLHHTSRWMVEI